MQISRLNCFSSTECVIKIKPYECRTQQDVAPGCAGPGGARRGSLAGRQRPRTHFHTISFQLYPMRLARNPRTPQMEVILSELRATDIKALVKYTRNKFRDEFLHGAIIESGIFVVLLRHAPEYFRSLVSFKLLLRRLWSENIIDSSICFARLPILIADTYGIAGVIV